MGSLVFGCVDATNQLTSTGELDPVQTLLSQAQGAIAGALFGGGKSFAAKQGSGSGGQLALGGTSTSTFVSVPTGVIEGIKSMLNGGHFEKVLVREL